MNQFDFEDAIMRGRRRGKEAARRALEKWARPEIETTIGRAVQQIAATPELKELQDPAVMREMEERYGKG